MTEELQHETSDIVMQAELEEVEFVAQQGSECVAKETETSYIAHPVASTQEYEDPALAAIQSLLSLEKDGIPSFIVYGNAETVREAITTQITSRTDGGIPIPSGTVVVVRTDNKLVVHTVPQQRNLWPLQEVLELLKDAQIADLQDILISGPHLDTIIVATSAQLCSDLSQSPQAALNFRRYGILRDFVEDSRTAVLLRPTECPEIFDRGLESLSSLPVDVQGNIPVLVLYLVSEEVNAGNYPQSTGQLEHSVLSEATLPLSLQSYTSATSSTTSFQSMADVSPSQFTTQSMSEATLPLFLQSCTPATSSTTSFQSMTNVPPSQFTTQSVATPPVAPACLPSQEFQPPSGTNALHPSKVRYLNARFHADHDTLVEHRSEPGSMRAYEQIVAYRTVQSIGRRLGMVFPYGGQSSISPARVSGQPFTEITYDDLQVWLGYNPNTFTNYRKLYNAVQRVYDVLCATPNHNWNHIMEMLQVMLSEVIHARDDRSNPPAVLGAFRISARELTRNLRDIERSLGGTSAA
ncbi:hypothetical protein K435DRAFT_789929 [Dendrothele bispora CBS 962.96]|uniref:Uncharacterized protein n=1 Tax=Dendrothele bispora (strain CBS 962.96) TaxID=1314807 RepID=A0A4S8MS16_DENBC|nr:hypothetical protein K435DRAFT_789929 [Dendrothele bispora CBS 962.96]